MTIGIFDPAIFDPAIFDSGLLPFPEPTIIDINGSAANPVFDILVRTTVSIAIQGSSSNTIDIMAGVAPLELAEV